MKIYYYFILVSIFCFSSIAADTKLFAEINYNNDIELDVDLDFCCEHRIRYGIGAVVETACRIFGFDSKAFVEAKNILKDPERRIELLMAILVASKYPEEGNFHDGKSLLMKEIKLVRQGDDFDSLQDLINSATLEKKVERTYSVEQTYSIVKRLKKAERRSIISNLLLQNPLIDSSSRLSDEDIERMTACLLPPLQSCAKP